MPSLLTLRFTVVSLVQQMAALIRGRQDSSLLYLLDCEVHLARQQWCYVEWLCDNDVEQPLSTIRTICCMQASGRDAWGSMMSWVWRGSRRSDVSDVPWMNNKFSIFDAEHRALALWDEVVEDDYLVVEMSVHRVFSYCQRLGSQAWCRKAGSCIVMYRLWLKRTQCPPYAVPSDEQHPPVVVRLAQQGSLVWDCRFTSSRYCSRSSSLRDVGMTQDRWSDFLLLNFHHAHTVFGTLRIDPIEEIPGPAFVAFCNGSTSEAKEEPGPGGCCHRSTTQVTLFDRDNPIEFGRSYEQVRAALPSRSQRPAVPNRALSLELAIHSVIGLVSLPAYLARIGFKFSDKDGKTSAVNSMDILLYGSTPLRVGS
ncbi:hypothetical protein V8D89_015846 [Ganoderma adspersum]